MKHQARSQEYEDQEDTELSQEYRLHQFPLPPTPRPAVNVVAMVLVIGFVALVGIALVLGFIAEVRFVLGLFR